MGENELVALIKTFGPTVAVLAFVLVWLKQDAQARERRDQEREARMGARLDDMTQLHHETFVTVVRDNMHVMDRAAAGLERCAFAMETMAKAAADCPKKKESDE